MQVEQIYLEQCTIAEHLFFTQPYLQQKQPSASSPVTTGSQPVETQSVFVYTSRRQTSTIKGSGSNPCGDVHLKIEKRGSRTDSRLNWTTDGLCHWRIRFFMLIHFHALSYLRFEGVGRPSPRTLRVCGAVCTVVYGIS